MISTAVTTVQNCFIPDDIETNKFATMVDEAEHKFIMEIAQQQNIHHEAGEIPSIPFCTMLRFRFKTLKKGVMNPLVLKFYIYLLLSGFFQPDFGNFGYYFALDVMHISKVFIGLSAASAGLFLILGPIFFQKYFRNTNYKKLFTLAQFIYIFQAFLLFLAAKRWNLAFYLPDGLIYFMATSLFEVMDRILTLIPSFIIMAKSIPPGVEATMTSFTITIINLN